jgi:hypothetical protein
MSIHIDVYRNFILVNYQHQLMIDSIYTTSMGEVVVKFSPQKYNMLIECVRSIEKVYSIISILHNPNLDKTIFHDLYDLDYRKVLNSLKYTNTYTIEYNYGNRFNVLDFDPFEEKLKLKEYMLSRI